MFDTFWSNLTGKKQKKLNHQANTLNSQSSWRWRSRSKSQLSRRLTCWFFEKKKKKEKYIIVKKKPFCRRANAIKTCVGNFILLLLLLLLRKRLIFIIYARSIPVGRRDGDITSANKTQCATTSPQLKRLSHTTSGRQRRRRRYLTGGVR